MQQIIISRDTAREGKYLYLTIKMPLVSTGNTEVIERVINTKEKKINCSEEFGILTVEVCGPIKRGAYSLLLSKVYTNKKLETLLVRACKKLDDVKRKDFIRYSQFRLIWIGMILNDDQQCSWTAFPTDVGAQTVEDAIANMKALYDAKIDTGAMKSAVASAFTVAGTTAVTAVAMHGGKIATMQVLNLATQKAAENTANALALDAAAAAANTFQANEALEAAQAAEKVGEAAVRDAERILSGKVSALSSAKDTALEASKNFTDLLYKAGGANPIEAQELGQLATSTNGDMKVAQAAVSAAKETLTAARSNLDTLSEATYEAAREKVSAQIDQSLAENAAANAAEAVASGETADYVLGSTADVTAVIGGVITAIPFVVFGCMLINKIVINGKKEYMSKLIDNCYMAATQRHLLQFCVDNELKGTVDWRELAQAADTLKATDLMDLECKIGVIL